MGGGSSTGSTDESVLPWLKEMHPVMRSLVSVTSAAQWPLDAGSEGKAATAESIETMARALFESIEANPSPDPELTERLGMVAARYRFAVLEIRLSLERRDDAGLRAAAGRLAALNEELEGFLGAGAGAGAGAGV